MKKHNSLIGFNDALLTLVGIPLLSFIIPIVFFNCRFDRPPHLTLSKYLATLLITAVIWMGNRQIMMFSRKRHPLFSAVRKRLFFQSWLMVLFTLAANMLLGIVFDDVFHHDLPELSFNDKLIHSNAASIFCTITVIAIYESIFFMHQLKHAVEESENLKRESLNAQLDALRTQVNPHFLFNNLNTLASLIPENPAHAVDFVQQLSKVYRHILEVKDEQSIPLRDELAVVKAYAFLLETRFGNNLQVSISIDDAQLNHGIVPLSLQLLMENAIKHNIVSAIKPLHIELFTANESLVIKNNLQTKKQISTSTGIGLDNIRNRYKLLGEKTITVSATENEFTVAIPLIALPKTAVASGNMYQTKL
jgi:two-component system, LytTR family, sensor kinase